MSPEQALGQETDYRSDQFSFGLILYEMASGKQAFAKPSSVETMAAIVRDEPSANRRKAPRAAQWIIDRCLAKEPDRATSPPVISSATWRICATTSPRLIRRVVVFSPQSRAKRGHSAGNFSLESPQGAWSSVAWRSA